MDPSEKWQNEARIYRDDLFVERYLFNRRGEEHSGRFLLDAFCHSFFKPEYNPDSSAPPWRLVSIVLNGRLSREYRKPGGLPVHTFSAVDLSDPAVQRRSCEGDALERYFILMKNGPLFQSLMMSLFGSEQVSFEPADPGKLEECFEEIGDFLAEEGAGEPVKLDSLVFRLLAEAAEQRRNGSADALTDRAEAYIRSHFQNSGLSREEIAEESGCCVSLLSHRFREKTGCTLRDYITDLRLKKAKQMLSFTDCRISEIAQECGYALPYHFSGEFRRKCGFVPSQYRKRNRIGGSL